MIWRVILVLLLLGSKGSAFMPLPGYDAADNLHTRANNALAETFTVDAANQLRGTALSGTLTVAGNTLAPAASVTVNGQPAQLYQDLTFAGANNSLTNGLNSFTTLAQNSSGATVSNTLTVNLPSSTTLASDANGNLTNDGLKGLSYDVENELTNVVVAGQWQSAFVYDGLGRRRIERDYVWANSAWVQTNEVHYIYDGSLILQERDASNGVLVTYTRGRDLAGGIQTAGLPGQSAATAGGIGGLLARTDTNGSAFYHADGLGNVTALINSSNYVVARYLYNPFGQVTAKWGPYADVNEMQFSSMPQHNPSGFSMYLYRAYDPHLQRWLNQDPIQEAGGINLYQYVGNDPINNIDPLGLWTFEIYGGWGFGAYFQIGYNDHHLSLSGGLGAAAGASISLDPKNTPSDLASGTWEGGLKGKLDFGEGPVGGGVEAEVGGTKDPCDHGKNYAKVGASGSFLFLSGSGDIGRETDEDGNNWHTTKEANWQENVPTSKNVWTGNWIPKERESAGGFFGPVIGYQF